jgi:hypothetical protein
MRKAIPFAMAVIAVVTGGLASARPLGHEAQSVVDALLKTPTIKTEPGFRAKMFIQPGELYDPLFMVPWGNTTLMNDDGKAIGDHGGRILSITPQGEISVVMDADQLLPILAFDEAPRGFGQFGNQFFSLAQPTSGMNA